MVGLRKYCANVEWMSITPLFTAASNTRLRWNEVCAGNGARLQCQGRQAILREGVTPLERLRTASTDKAGCYSQAIRELKNEGKCSIDTEHRQVNCHREDHGVARRANALLLLDDGESCAQIADSLPRR